MSRPKLNLSKEERRRYDNEMHRKQEQARREKRKREAYIRIVQVIVDTFEALGWDKTDLVVGADRKMVEAVADELIKRNEFDISLGTKLKIKESK